LVRHRDVCRHTSIASRRAADLVARAVDLLADRIRMAHAKDRDAAGGFATAGQGVIDFGHFIGCLRAAGFDEVRIVPLADGGDGTLDACGRDLAGLVCLIAPQFTPQRWSPAFARSGPENATAKVRVAFPEVTGRKIRVTIDDVRENRASMFATQSTRLAHVIGSFERSVSVALQRSRTS
jgi:hypothetical protein